MGKSFKEYLKDMETMEQGKREAVEELMQAAKENYTLLQKEKALMAKNEVLKTPKEWYRIMQYEKAKKKYRDLLSFLMNETIPALEEMSFHIGSQNQDSEISKLKEWCINQTIDITSDLKEAIIESVSRDK